MTDRELMQQALEALETNQYAVADAAPHRDVMAYNDVITALRERLAQPAPGCAECGKSGGWALYCVACMEKMAQPEPVAHSIVAGALFDFMGWLTSRKERLVLSSSAEASPAVEAIQEFAKMRGLSLADADVQNWQQALASQQPREWVGLTDDEIAVICGECAASAHRTDDISYARAIEAKLKEKNNG